MATYLVKHPRWSVKFKYIKTYTNIKGEDIVVCHLSNYAEDTHYNPTFKRMLQQEFPLSEVEIIKLPSKFSIFLKKLFKKRIKLFPVNRKI
jgi:hypothetical protein